MRLPRHVDRISDDKADLTYELMGQSFRTLWSETACIKAVDGGSVNTCLPYTQFVVSSESVSSSKYTGESAEIAGAHLHSVRQCAVLEVIIAYHSA